MGKERLPKSICEPRKAKKVRIKNKGLESSGGARSRSLVGMIGRGRGKEKRQGLSGRIVAGIRAWKAAAPLVLWVANGGA